MPVTIEPPLSLRGYARSPELNSSECIRIRLAPILRPDGNQARASFRRAPIAGIEAHQPDVAFRRGLGVGDPAVVLRDSNALADRVSGHRDEGADLPGSRVEQRNAALAPEDHSTPVAQPCRPQEELRAALVDLVVMAV